MTGLRTRFPGQRRAPTGLGTLSFLSRSLLRGLSPLAPWGRPGHGSQRGCRGSGCEKLTGAFPARVVGGLPPSATYRLCAVHSCTAKLGFKVTGRVASRREGGGREAFLTVGQDETTLPHGGGPPPRGRGTSRGLCTWGGWRRQRRHHQGR